MSGISSITISGFSRLAPGSFGSNCRMPRKRVGPQRQVHQPAWSIHDDECWSNRAQKTLMRNSTEMILRTATGPLGGLRPKRSTAGPQNELRPQPASGRPGRRGADAAGLGRPAAKPARRRRTVMARKPSSG